jgi:hypothetical protein
LVEIEIFLVVLTRWGSLLAPPEPLAVGREGNEERRKEGEEGRRM